MIATLQKQVEKSRQELATEKTDNERLKKQLARLQSSQSDQMSKVVSEVEELHKKLKGAEIVEESVKKRIQEWLNVFRELRRD